MRRSLAAALLILAGVVPVPAHAQFGAQTIPECVLQSGLKGLEVLPVAMLSPSQRLNMAPQIYGVFSALMLSTCAINPETAEKNQRAQRVHRADVQQYHAYKELFQHAVGVVGYGDASGTQPDIGAGDLAFLKLIPTLMAQQARDSAAQATDTAWMRQLAAQRRLDGSTRIVSYSIGVRGDNDELSAAPSRLFQDWDAGGQARASQAAFEAAMMDADLALEYEVESTELAAVVDSVEAAWRATPVGSGRAAQLRALIAYREAMRTVLLLRMAAAELRAAADAASLTATGPARRQMGLAVSGYAP